MMEDKKIAFVCLAFIILSQIVVICSGVNYQWKFILIAFLMLFLFIIFLTFFCIHKYNKTGIHFKNKDYDYVIKAKIVFSFGIDEIKSGYYYMKAISYLERDDYDNFSICISNMNHPRFELTKCYLNIIYCHIRNDDEKLREYKLRYDEFSQNCCDSQKEKYDKILELLQKKDFSDDEKVFIEQLPFNSIKKLILNRIKN